MNSKLALSSKVFLALASICLVISTFVPIWQIDLDAPQYPEGLGLKIYADKLGGDVEIINGLNHYIGMKTLHAEDFIEFSVLTYIIYAYALLCIITILINNKKVLYVLLGLFIAFGILAMVDFWRWEYDYGHDLDPNAAIIVPGMAYQPPLIGFKQLLNFGAYSIPDIGGWLFIVSGVLMVLATLTETGFLGKIFKKKAVTPAVVLLMMVSMSACNNSDVQPISYNKDNCDYCKMTLADNRFGAELLTSKGRAYKFDDISCMIGYVEENKDKVKDAKFFVSDFYSHELVNVSQLTFVRGDDVASPMGGNIASFSIKDSASTFNKSINGEMLLWNNLIK